MTRYFPCRNAIARLGKAAHRYAIAKCAVQLEDAKANDHLPHNLLDAWAEHEAARAHFRVVCAEVLEEAEAMGRKK
jgi:hypothetical protein